MNVEDKILEGLKSIEITQAVTNEKLRSIYERLDTTNRRLDHANTEFEKIEKRVDLHDKVVGGVVIAFGILTTLIKFKIL